MAKTEQLTRAEPRTIFEQCWEEVLKESERFGSGNFIAHEYLEPILRKYIGDHTYGGENGDTDRRQKRDGHL